MTVDQLKKTAPKNSRLSVQPAQPSTAAQLPQIEGRRPASAALQRALANPFAASPAALLQLQRSYGNQAVSSLVQAKLKVGPAGDKYEQEADRVANQVMRMSPPTAKKPLQRQEDEEELQMQPLVAHSSSLVTHHYPIVNRQSSIQNQEDGFETSASFERSLSLAQSSGNPLPAQLRAEFEPKFGVDFSGVRVHTDSRAAQLNRQINAQAFTRGQDIFFNQGAYTPNSSAGKRLIAHELTHTVQQTGGAQRRIQRWSLGTGWGVFTKPVHETLTKLSLLEGGLLEEDQSAKQYKRGARWNDNPMSDLETRIPLWGLIKFGARYKFGSKKGLTHRSHEGDLQFLHGMAEAGEQAAITQGKVMLWAEFAYKVGSGIIAPDTKLKDVPIAEFSNLLLAKGKRNLGKITVAGLFGTKKAARAQQRAVGSLLHMMQDTFAFSHSQREEQTGSNLGKIKTFLSYGAQKGSLHKQGDVPLGEGSSLKEKIMNTPNARQAVEQGARIASLIKNKIPWTAARPVFEDIFGLSEQAQPAGPGGEFVADTLPTAWQFKKSTWVHSTRKAARRSQDRLLSEIDESLKSYGKIRNKIRKDTKKTEILNDLKHQVTQWLATYNPQDPYQRKRKPGVQKLLDAINAHRLMQ